MSCRITGAACRGDISAPTCLPACFPLPSDSCSTFCKWEQPGPCNPQPMPDGRISLHAASSWDAWADGGAMELHSGAPRSCELPMMFILQAAKHFVEGSFIQALFKIAFIQKISFSHLHILQTVWRGSCRSPTCSSPAPLPPALALPDGNDCANTVSAAPERVYLVPVRGAAAGGSFCPNQTFLSAL